MAFIPSDPVDQLRYEMIKALSSARNSIEVADIQRYYNKRIEYANQQGTAMGFQTSIGALPHNLGGYAPETPKMLPEERIVAPIVGWRRWFIDPWDDKLYSNNKTVWEPLKRIERTCKAGPSISYPAGLNRVCRGLRCSCGIYAYKTREQLETKDNSLAPREMQTAVYGEVYLWGKIVEHEIGFRAQYAYPKSFVNKSMVAEELARTFHVKVID